MTAVAPDQDIRPETLTGADNVAVARRTATLHFADSRNRAVCFRCRTAHPCEPALWAGDILTLAGEPHP